MSKNIVIVESPSKSKTIEKYLGSSYKVVSSKGHICDLDSSGKERMGIDVEHDFKPSYKVSKEKKDVVEELKKAVSKANQIYLASDPDREGEAIAYHLARVLELDPEKTSRIVFHEVTKPAVLEALEHPGQIDMDLVKSQETRRLLDRIIGFKLSKLLKNKIQSQSAGRVQSVALRLIIDREKEIKAFKSEEYWTIDALYEDVVAQLTKVDNKKPKLTNQEQAQAIVDRCQGEFVVSAVDKKAKKKATKLPYTTSSLQQEASTKLGFGARRTMSIAQKLYEGIQLGSGQEGLISYMRTDSTRLSPVFIKEAFTYIEQTYTKAYVGKVHQKNMASSQDAHEAIRPTDIRRTPESIKSYLTAEQYKLYRMIYYRTLASLMKDAKVDATTIQFENHGCLFKATGQVITFDGYLKVWKEYESASDQPLPELSVGQSLVMKLDSKQHFTQPPARYTEAKLIKELEEQSIGRPSTYATIIDTIQKRGYVNLEKSSELSRTKVFVPTDQGFVTDEALRDYFKDIINVRYTAQMEQVLDDIAEGKQESVEYLHHFWDQFNPMVQSAYEVMPKRELEQVGENCPECGSPLVYRRGRFGRFISCSNFPTCKYTRDENPVEAPEEKKVCPNCGADMVVKKGRYGPFWACSRYPECKTIESFKKKEPPKPTGEMCPECGHELVIRKSRYGKDFVACSNYPKCRYIKKEAKK